MPNDQKSLGPAATYRHEHAPIQNVNVQYQKKLTYGQRLSDKVTAMIGSWPFIITQSFFLGLWIVVNVYLVVMIKTHPDFLRAWDPYPFILLNLVLSFQAAYTGPVVMMSQNRAADKDRLMAEHDFETNTKAEEEIVVIMKHLTHQDKLTNDMIARLESLQAALPAQDAVQSLGAAIQHLEENESRILALVERMENPPNTGQR